MVVVNVIMINEFQTHQNGVKPSFGDVTCTDALLFKAYKLLMLQNCRIICNEGNQILEFEDIVQNNKES